MSVVHLVCSMLNFLTVLVMGNLFPLLGIEYGAVTMLVNFNYNFDLCPTNVSNKFRCGHHSLDTGCYIFCYLKIGTLVMTAVSRSTIQVFWRVDVWPAVDRD